MKKIKEGSKVRCINSKWHGKCPDCYPDPNVVGVVVFIDGHEKAALVQWPIGSTSGDDKWFYIIDRDLVLA